MCEDEREREGERGEEGRREVGRERFGDTKHFKMKERNMGHNRRNGRHVFKTIIKF